MIKLVDIPCFGENDGKLCAFEPNMIPGFSVERIFYIYDAPENAIRANHACMNASILLCAINGSVTVSAECSGITEEYNLNKKNQGLFLPEKSWIKAYNFSDGAVLMCLSNKEYKDCEYIDNYEDYKRRVSK